MAGVLDPPMAANRVGETFHSPRQAADEVTDFSRLLAVANARQHRHADRQQALPETEPRQRFRCGHSM